MPIPYRYHMPDVSLLATYAITCYRIVVKKKKGAAGRKEGGIALDERDRTVWATERTLTFAFSRGHVTYYCGLPRHARVCAPSNVEDRDVRGSRNVGIDATPHTAPFHRRTLHLRRFSNHAVRASTVARVPAARKPYIMPPFFAFRHLPATLACARSTYSGCKRL